MSTASENKREVVHYCEVDERTHTSNCRPCRGCRVVKEDAELAVSLSGKDNTGVREGEGGGI